LPDSPRTDPGVQFSRTGLFKNTRIRNPAQGKEAADVVFRLTAFFLRK
jgi:hypothetical protein